MIYVEGMEQIKPKRLPKCIKNVANFGQVQCQFSLQKRTHGRIIQKNTTGLASFSEHKPLFFFFSTQGDVQQHFFLFSSIISERTRTIFERQLIIQTRFMIRTGKSLKRCFLFCPYVFFSSTKYDKLIREKHLKKIRKNPSFQQI